MPMRFLLPLFVCLCWLPAHAAPLVVGDTFPPIVAKDQFGKDFTLTTNIQFVLVAMEMACAKAANHKLAEQGAGFLEKQRAAYLMDVHTMPAVARWFAFPKMRKYPQRIMLVDSWCWKRAPKSSTNALRCTIPRAKARYDGMIQT